LVKGKVVAKVVDEMWTYLYKNARAFYKWVFTCYVYTKLGVYLILGIGVRVLSLRSKSIYPTRG
jgi:hypothetical protein